MKKEIDTLAEISRDLSEKRAPSMYGLETLGKTPSQLFDRRDAEDALKKAEYVHKLASKFLEEFYCWSYYKNLKVLPL